MSLAGCGNTQGIEIKSELGVLRCGTFDEFKFVAWKRMGVKKIKNLKREDDIGSADGLNLDQSIAFRLIRIINLMRLAFPAEDRADGALSVLEWRTLAVVAFSGPSTMTEIANYTGYKQMNISRSLQSLEKLGFVERLTDPEDRRRSVVHLTETGRDVYLEISRSASEVEASLLAGISTSDLSVVDKVLNQMLHNLDQN